MTTELPEVWSLTHPTEPLALKLTAKLGLAQVGRMMGSPPVPLLDKLDYAHPSYKKDAAEAAAEIRRLLADLAVLETALSVVSKGFDNFVDACIDKTGASKAPERSAMMKARAMLPPSCKHACAKKA